MKPNPPIWLDDVIIINESNEYASAGAVDIYRNAAEAYYELEEWFVDEQYYAMAGNGHRVRFTVEGFTTHVVEVDKSKTDLETLYNWLVEVAQYYLKQRQNPKPKKTLFGKKTSNVFITEHEKAGILPSSIEGLIAYIGFHS